MKLLRFDVFGRRVVVERSTRGWEVFYPGADGKRRRATDIVIPSDLPESGVERYLADLCHEWATENHPEVRQVVGHRQVITETPDQRIRRVTREAIAIVPYDPVWPASFRQEKEHLLSCLPSDLIVRIEHFGSTAVPGLSAKPIVDMLAEVTDLQATRAQIAPVLEAQGYDYFWRPTHGDDGPPFYAWFIKRDPETGERTHHIHMVEKEFTEHWDRLLFRDYLIAHPEVAGRYADLKFRLASDSPHDRVRYTRAKTAFITRMTNEAKRYYGKT